MENDLMQNFFKKLLEKEKNKIIESFIKTPTDLLFKFEDSGVFKARILGIDKNGLLVCKKPSSYQGIHFGEIATLNFTISNEKFFFKSKILISEDKLIIDVSGDFFLLQRRKNRRIKISEKTINVIKIQNINGRKTLLEAKAFDISIKGLKIDFYQNIPQIKASSLVQISIKIGLRKSFEVEGIVRHHKNILKEGMSGQNFGIEFIKLNSEQEEKIQQLFDDLHRDIFQNMEVGRF